jgi:hypothetical protein
MPRVKRSLESPKPRFPKLLAELVDELRTERQAGQPLIDELTFPKTNLVSVTVIWDRWAPLSDEERSTTIRQAYGEVEGREFRDRIALASGLTVPEAHEYGMLPYRVLPALRKGDPVTAEQCARAMLEQGASLLLDPKKAQLRFATEEQANACVERLGRVLPGSEGTWIVLKE